MSQPHNIEKRSPKFLVDAIRPLKRFNTLRILCDDDVNPNDFLLSKPMPDDITNGLQQMINEFEKYGQYHHIETLQKLIQYLSQSDIKLEYIQGITYMPYD